MNTKGIKKLIKDIKNMDVRDCIRQGFCKQGKFCPLGKLAIKKGMQVPTIEGYSVDCAILSFVSDKYDLPTSILGDFFHTYDRYSDPHLKKGKTYAKNMGIKALEQHLAK